ncbi:hypothetical protein J6590_103810, partial [Homalodisca vitripennis]
TVHVKIQTSTFGDDAGMVRARRSGVGADKCGIPCSIPEKNNQNFVMGFDIFILYCETLPAVAQGRVGVILTTKGWCTPHPPPACPSPIPASY